MMNYHDIRFSEDGTRAVCSDGFRIGESWSCFVVTWKMLNGATHVATLKDYGTTYNIKKANEWLAGQEIELAT